MFQQRGLSLPAVKNETAAQPFVHQRSGQTRACGDTLRLLEPPVAPFRPAGLEPRGAAAPAGGLTNAKSLDKADNQ